MCAITTVSLSKEVWDEHHRLLEKVRLVVCTAGKGDIGLHGIIDWVYRHHHASL